MISFEIEYDHRVFEQTDNGLTLRISNDKDNCLKMLNGKVSVNTTGGVSDLITTNTPGNGVAGVPTDYLYKIGFNKTVSRRVLYDDLQQFVIDNEGVLCIAFNKDDPQKLSEDCLIGKLLNR